MEFISKYIEIMCCLKYRQVGKKSGASMKKKKKKIQDNQNSEEVPADGKSVCSYHLCKV